MISPRFCSVIIIEISHFFCFPFRLLYHIKPDDTDFAIILDKIRENERGKKDVEHESKKIRK